MSDTFERYTGASRSLFYYLCSFHEKRGAPFASGFMKFHNNDVLAICALLESCETQEDLDSPDVRADAIAIKRLLATRDRLRVVRFHHEFQAWFSACKVPDKFVAEVSPDEVAVLYAGNPYVFTGLLFDCVSQANVVPILDRLWNVAFALRDDFDDSDDGSDDGGGGGAKAADVSVAAAVPLVHGVPVPSVVEHRLRKRRALLEVECLRRRSDSRASDSVTVPELLDLWNTGNVAVSDFELTGDGTDDERRASLVRFVVDFDPTLGAWRENALYKAIASPSVVEYWRMPSFVLYERFYAATGTDLFFQRPKALERLVPKLCLVSSDESDAASVRLHQRVVAEQHFLLQFIRPAAPTVGA